MVYGEYWGCGYSNKYRKIVKFHWTSTAANIPNQLYYVMDTTDLDTLKKNEPVTFGTKALVLKRKTLRVMGNDNEWYEI